MLVLTEGVDEFLCVLGLDLLDLHGIKVDTARRQLLCTSAKGLDVAIHLRVVGSGHLVC